MPHPRHVTAACIVVCLLAAPLSATAETAPLTVQGPLLTVAGEPAPDGDYVGSFSLWSAETDGEELWSETQGIVVAGAQFSALLGLDTPIDSALYSGDATVWVQLKIGSEPPLARRPLHAVPVAVAARTLACSGCVTTAHLDASAVATIVAGLGYAKSADLAPVALSGKYSDLTDAPSLAKVATSGLYADLSGGPDLSGYAKLTLDSNMDFAKHQALRFRLQTAAADPEPCTLQTLGMIYYNTSSKQILMCDGKIYTSVATVGDIGTEGNPALTCLDLKTTMRATSTGFYYINPEGSGGVKVYCEMDLEGGGWTLVGKFNLNKTGPTVGGITWRADNDVNLDYLAAPDNDAVINAGHLSRDRTVAIANLGERKMMNFIKQHTSQKNKYCWNHYSAGVDSNWSYVSGSSGSPGVGSCGKLGWGYGNSCGATSTSCSGYDANYTMDSHWMHANGLNSGTLSGVIQTYCGDNSTSGIGSSGAATGDRRGTCYLYAK